MSTPMLGIAKFVKSSHYPLCFQKPNNMPIRIRGSEIPLSKSISLHANECSASRGILTEQYLDGCIFTLREYDSELRSPRLEGVESLQKF